MEHHRCEPPSSTAEDSGLDWLRRMPSGFDRGQKSCNFSSSSSLPAARLKRLPDSDQTLPWARSSRARKISIARQICDTMQHRHTVGWFNTATHRRSLIDICRRHCNDLAHHISLVHKFCALFSSVLVCVPGCALRDMSANNYSSGEDTRHTHQSPITSMSSPQPRAPPPSQGSYAQRPSGRYRSSARCCSPSSHLNSGLSPHPKLPLRRTPRNFPDTDFFFLHQRPRPTRGVPFFFSVPLPASQTGDFRREP